MPGKDSRFTDKQDREAQHIKESEEKRGHSEKDSERIAYATVNKQRHEKGETKDQKKK